MANDDHFQSTTMRISVAPDKKPAVAAPKPKGFKDPVAATTGPSPIRIPRSKSDSTPIGGPDFTELLQNIYDAAVITTLTGEIVVVNVRAVQFFRGTRHEVTRGSILGLVSGATPTLLNTIRETLKNDRFVLIQAFCNRKDGTSFPAEISVNRLHLSTLDYLIFFIRDITLRKEAEERLRTGYNAIQNAANGIAIADGDMTVTYVNPAILRLWGFPESDDIRGLNIRTFLVDESRADEIVRSVSAGETWANELEMKRRDGTTFFAQISIAPNTNPDGELAGMVFSMVDITPQKRAQQELAAYAQQLSERNQQMEDDLRMAGEVQQAFIPRTFPIFPVGVPPEESALVFSSLYLPSGMVGGDFFDILTVSPTQAGIFICDVMGHGTRAALVVATLRGLIEQLTPINHDPGAFLTALNDAYSVIFKQTTELMFATAVYVVVDVTSGRMLYSNAGHPFPFRLRPALGTVEPLEFAPGAKGPAIGLFEQSTFKNDECWLDPGDRLILYTDGLTEAKGSNVEDYETTRLLEVLCQNIAAPPEQLLKKLVADVQQFSGTTQFEDDVCIVGMEARRLVAKSEG